MAQLVYEEIKHDLDNAGGAWREDYDRLLRREARDLLRGKAAP